MNGGQEYTQETEDTVLEMLSRHGIQRNLSLLGGEPLLPRNIEALTKLCKRVKEELPKTQIWCWTGFLYEDVKDYPIIPYLDVLVDGQFVLEDRDITLDFRGSPNQRVIDIPKTLKNNSIVLYKVNK